MSATPAAPGASGVVPVRVELTVNNRRLTATVPAPAGPVAPGVMLHVLQSLADTLVNLAIGQAAATKGQRLSCRPGCGACCRQLVPVSRTEARRVAEVVDALPEPRRSAVRQRFADAVRRFAEAGLLDRVRASDAVPAEDVQALGEAYFRVGVPCPLLEDESCSIYPDRPLVCREYLVYSDPVHCQDPTAANVRKIEVRGKLGGLVGRWEREIDRVNNVAPPRGGDESLLPWVPLVLALEWAAANPEPPATLTGPEHVKAMMTALTGKAVGTT